MPDTLLITLGCSWTFGVGSGYESGMSKEDFQWIAQDSSINDSKSWRGVLCAQHGLTNRNLAVGGSSNQKQFRLAKQYFSSDQFQRDRDDYQRIMVLWGITSTARNEIYSLSHRDFFNFFYTQPTDFSKFFITHSYDHNAETAILKIEMQHWNQFFRALGIENHWFDTFNTHHYIDYDHRNDLRPTETQVADAQRHYESIAGPDWPSYHDYSSGNWGDIPQYIIDEIKQINPAVSDRFNLRITLNEIQARNTVDRLIDADKTPRDLLSWLCDKHGVVSQDHQYHLSDLSTDSDKILPLVKMGLLNPISSHPTQRAHQDLADFFSERINFS